MDHDCSLCHVSENPDQKVIFGDDTVLFLQKGSHTRIGIL
jgi:hypothetical protein